MFHLDKNPYCAYTEKNRHCHSGYRLNKPAGSANTHTNHESIKQLTSATLILISEKMDTIGHLSMPCKLLYYM